MKHWICMLLTALLLCSCALGEDFYIKRYPIAENGEAIVNDVPFFSDGQATDNNRVFYEIFVGSFSDSNGDGIGDLRGIINRMDYLNDGDPDSGLSLGVEGLWLTPIFTSPSYHKYDVANFYEVDPSFGTMADLQELIDLCHERNVLIILDLPINHTSTRNRWFTNFTNAHILNNPRNSYYDFYVWRNKGDALPAGRQFYQVPGQALLYEGNFSDAMPEPDFDQPQVRKAMLDVALHYLNMGVDGFRFDAAKYIFYGDHQKSVDFWHWYIGELRKVKPDIYTVAEVWDGDGIIDQYLPATSCFHFTTSQMGLITETAREGDVNRFTAYMENYLNKLDTMGDHALSCLFLANHDMDRAAGYLTMASGNAAMAANLYLLSPGSPFIYYGEEIGLRGSRGGANTDANRRLAMKWGDGDTVRNPEGSTYTSQSPYSVQDFYPMASSLYNHYKQLIMIRKANPEIARGEYKALSFPNTKVGGFTATWNESTVAVIHNTTDSTRKVDVSGLPVSTLSCWAGMGQCILEDGTLILEGRTSAILR